MVPDRSYHIEPFNAVTDALGGFSKCCIVDRHEMRPVTDEHMRKVRLNEWFDLFVLKRRYHWQILLSQEEPIICFKYGGVASTIIPNYQASNNGFFRLDREVSLFSDYSNASNLESRPMLSHELQPLQTMPFIGQVAFSGGEKELFFGQVMLFLGKLPRELGFPSLVLSANGQVLGGLRQSLGSAPQKQGGAEKAGCAERQDKREYCYPGVGLKPEYATLGGLGLGCLFNGLGTWLYLNDLNRGRRRWRGPLLALAGWSVAIGGYVWSAMNGGGY
jgi:hypothetical protein